MSELLRPPKSVKETRVAEPPQEGYEAYLYKYTNLDHPGKKAYLGIHKGDINDGYTNSSTHEEFNELLANPKSNFLYEVLEYGTYSLMTVRESDILTSGRNENKEAWYNKTNGSPKFSVPDFNAVNLLIKKVKGDHYPVTYKERDYLENLTFLQVRTEEHTDLKHDIAQSIDENAGDTSECEPIVIFEGRSPDGGDIGGDGNHTTKGGLTSIKMKSMPVIVVPLSDNQLYSATELATFSNQMNAGSRVRKNPASPNDLKRILLKMIVDTGDKSTLDDPSVKNWLVEQMHTTKKKANGLIRSAKAQYEKDRGIDADKTWRHYTDTEFKAWIRRYERGNPNSIVIGINSNFVKYDQIMSELEMNLKRDKKGLLLDPIQPERLQVTFLIRHKSSTHVDRWDDALSKNLKNTVYPYLTLLGMKPRMEVLPTLVVSTVSDHFEFKTKVA